MSRAGVSLERQAVDVLSATMIGEDAFISGYDRLAPLMPDAESRELVMRLGMDSLRCVGILGNIIGRLGGGLVLPPDEPPPRQSELVPFFQRQLERKKEGLALLQRAVGLVPSQYGALLQEVADQEVEDIQAVERILGRLWAAG